MPTRTLPSNPNLEHLKYQAKDLLRGHAGRLSSVAQRIREFHPHFAGAPDAQIFAAPLRLSDAQLTIAREYGFRSWTRLRAHVDSPALAERLNMPHHERIDDPDFRRAVDLLDAGDVAALRNHLKQHPKLVHQRVEFEGGNYFRTPTLLEFIAENPIRRGTLAKEIVAIATVILDAGADRSSVSEALGLVATGRVVRESGAQIALIHLLCDRGADPDPALHAAVAHGEFEAAEVLLQRGGRMSLPVAAALGRLEDFLRSFPAAGDDEHHRALAFASQYGRTEIVRLLLESGENPNRYNPPGAHSHSTPLHQAALAGHRDIVEMLVSHGGDVNTRDLLWNGTPADWARHERRIEIEAYLRSLEKRTSQKLME